MDSWELMTATVAPSMVKSSPWWSLVLVDVSACPPRRGRMGLEERHGKTSALAPAHVDASPPSGNDCGNVPASYPHPATKFDSSHPPACTESSTIFELWLGGL